MDILQQNKFSTLHNGSTIFFCKTELLTADFKKIRKLNNQIILISGNSDDAVTEQHIKQLPENVLTWYCQNNTVVNDRVRSIPIGIENTVTSKRKGHGVAWPHALPKLELLTNTVNGDIKQTPVKLIYSNFNAGTNFKHRGQVKNICQQSNFITWREPTLSFKEFVDDVLDHQAVICPAGNGVDTHRLYEVLYCGRIPVTIKTGDYALYEELYQHLPIVVLDTVDQLLDRKKLVGLINQQRQKPVNMELIDFTYWKHLISNEASHIIKKNSTAKKILKKVFTINRLNS